MRFVSEADEVDRTEILLAAVLAHGVEGGAQEVHVGDAGDLDRILEGQEDAFGGPFLRCHLRDVPAFVEHFASGDLVAVAAGEDAARASILPEPLGPMMACTSPGFTERLMPRRISLSSTRTFKFLTSSMFVSCRLSWRSSAPMSSR